MGDDLKLIEDLKARGLLTDEEYEAKKRLVLGLTQERGSEQPGSARLERPGSTAAEPRHPAGQGDLLGHKVGELLQARPTAAS